MFVSAVARTGAGPGLTPFPSLMYSLISGTGTRTDRKRVEDSCVVTHSKTRNEPPSAVLR